MTTIGIIRHGQTEWNQLGKAQGNADIPLNEVGLLGAKKLAERLVNDQWDVAYTSDLMRAKQTAEIIISQVGIPLFTDPRLREVGGGLIEGTTEEERIAKWGIDWRDKELGIERDDVVLSRGLSMLEEITSSHEGEKVLLISHGSFLRKLLKELIKGQKTDSLSNTSFSIIQKKETVWECNLYNCVLHLEKEFV